MNRRGMYRGGERSEESGHRNEEKEHLDTILMTNSMGKQGRYKFTKGAKNKEEGCGKNEQDIKRLPERGWGIPSSGRVLREGGFPGVLVLVILKKGENKKKWVEPGRSPHKRKKKCSVADFGGKGETAE